MENCNNPLDMTENNIQTQSSGLVLKTAVLLPMILLLNLLCVKNIIYN